MNESVSQDPFGSEDLRQAAKKWETAVEFVPIVVNEGTRPRFWIKFDGPKEEADRFVVWLRENYTDMARRLEPDIVSSNSYSDVSQEAKAAIEQAIHDLVEKIGESEQEA
jgi:hypothetical protein